MSILDVPVSEIKPPSKLPQGKYRVKVSREPKITETQSGWDILTIPCQVLDVECDVDHDELEEFGRGVNGVYVDSKFFFPTRAAVKGAEGRIKRAKWDLKLFIEKLGVERPEGNISLHSWLKECVGAEFIAKIAHEQRKNSDITDLKIAEAYAVNND